ncbi:MAG: hypothetical protein ACLGIW_12850, partial [Gammaproteobacteria bacterium]
MGDPVILPRTDTGSVTGTSSRNAASATAGPACTSNHVDQQSHANNIGKAELVCCVRIPAAGGGKRRQQEVSTHSTMTRSLA